MDDRREKAIRDQQWLLNSARAQGFAEGLAEAREERKLKGEINTEIYVIQNLQNMFGFSVSDETSLRSQSLEQLRLIKAELIDRIKHTLPLPASETEIGSEE
jgi:hypothetical protein